MYKGEACKEYTIGSVMHGGCALGLVMSALLNHQRSTAHPDPAHVSAQYLSATTAGPVEILVKNVSVSNRWTRVEASMWQNGTERLRTHSQFADLPPSDDPKARGEPSRDNMNVLPETNSPYARWCPMTVPPGASKREELFKGANFKEYVRWSEYVPVEDTAPEGRKKLEWAAWLELKDARDARKARDEDPRVMAILATFAADMFRNGIELLPEHQSPGSSCAFLSFGLARSLIVLHQVVPDAFDVDRDEDQVPATERWLRNRDRRNVLGLAFHQRRSTRPDGRGVVCADAYRERRADAGRVAEGGQDTGREHADGARCAVLSQQEPYVKIIIALLLRVLVVVVVVVAAVVLVVPERQ